MMRSTIKIMQLNLLIALAIFATATSSPFRPTHVTSAINAFYKNNRFKGAFLTCSIKAVSADYVAQRLSSAKQREDDARDVANEDDRRSRLSPLGKARGGALAVEKKDAFKLDLRRTTAFFVYGGFYQGMGVEALYSFIYPLLGTGTDFLTVAKKVVMDLGFVSPLITIPLAYLVKGMFSGSSITTSLRSYWDGVVNKGLIFKNWMIFVPVQCLTFSVIPKHFRVSFVACVSFFWTILLSRISGS